MGPGDSAGLPNPGGQGIGDHPPLYDPTYGPNYDTSTEGDGSLATPGKFPDLPSLGTLLGYIPWWVWAGVVGVGALLLLNELNPLIELTAAVVGKRK